MKNTTVMNPMQSAMLRASINGEHGYACLAEKRRHVSPISIRVHGTGLPVSGGVSATAGTDVFATRTGLSRGIPAWRPPIC